VRDAGGKTALTLYLNDDGKGNHCWKFRQEEMFTWVEKYVTDDLKNGLDYVLVSFYEEDPNNDCRNEPSIDGEDKDFPTEQMKRWEGRPLDPDWVTVFSKLAHTFPKAQVGFGECGTELDNKKREHIVKYYRSVDDYLRTNLPGEYRRRYIGGYFWWYFRDDMIPKNKKLWGFFNDVINQRPNPS
jgi:hypothetical protein